MLIYSMSVSADGFGKSEGGFEWGVPRRGAVSSPDRTAPRRFCCRRPKTLQKLDLTRRGRWPRRVDHGFDVRAAGPRLPGFHAGDRRVADAGPLGNLGLAEAGMVARRAQHRGCVIKQAPRHAETSLIPLRIGCKSGREPRRRTPREGRSPQGEGYAIHQWARGFASGANPTDSLFGGRLSGGRIPHGGGAVCDSCRVDRALRAGRSRVSRAVVFGAALAAATVASIPASAAAPSAPSSKAQPPALPAKWVGTWHLVSEHLVDQNGAVVGVAFTDAVGKVTYTPRGDLWAIVGPQGPVQRRTSVLVYGHCRTSSEGRGNRPSRAGLLGAQRGWHRSGSRLPVLRSRQTAHLDGGILVGAE